MAISKMDWDVINSRVSRISAENGKIGTPKAFLMCVLEHYFPSLGDDVLEVITDGPNDRGIDAINIIEKEDTAEVFIFQSKYRDSYITTNKTIRG